jgi:hypothetical protein
MRARLLASLLVLLTSSACIEDTLNVDIATQVFPDGTCSRHVVYRLERTGGTAEDPVRILPSDDPLRVFHRFPTGDAWTVKDDVRTDSHTLDLEALLPSADAIEGDYWRSATKRGSPARNVVSFSRTEHDGSEVEFEYAETFRDPASPLEGMRALAQAVARRDDAFAAGLLKDLGSSPLQSGEVKRAYRRALAEPFTREVGRIASRPIWGPRERKQLEDAMDRFDALQNDLARALAMLDPSVDEAAFAAAIDRVQEPLGPEILEELTRAGLPFPMGKSAPSPIHFRVTLTLPGSIVRANSCAQGDTATWEFDQQDLYGRGFEMWAKSVGR